MQNKALSQHESSCNLFFGFWYRFSVISKTPEQRVTWLERIYNNKSIKYEPEYLGSFK